MARSLGTRMKRLLGALTPRTGRSAASSDPVITYAPDPDGAPDPGEVVWAWIPFEEDPSQGKDRPALVIGWSGDHLAAIPLSSKDHSSRRDASDWIGVGSGPWDPGGRPSYADAARLVLLDPHAVRREGATLPREAFEAVVTRARVLHRWSDAPVPTGRMGRGPGSEGAIT